MATSAGSFLKKGAEIYTINMPQARNVRKKQILLYQGEATAQIFVVRTGVVRAFTTLDNGNEAIIALYGTGDYFPVITNPTQAPVALFFYEAMTDATIETMSIADFPAYLQTVEAEQFDNARRYLGALLHIHSLAQQTAFDKLVHTLRYLALRFGEQLQGGMYTRIQLKLTQQDIADLCTVSRETANIELSKLKAKKIVTEKGKVYAVNIAALTKLIGDDIGADLQI